jgi:cysteine desulfurase / selenocysteine lyase
MLEYRSDLVPDARRYEVGTLGFQDFLGFAHSVELLLELGVAATGAHVQAVQAPLLSWAARRDDVRLISDPSPARRSGIVCLAAADLERLHGALLGAGIICTIREGALRIAPHFYNTVEEMERVVEVLEEALEQ